MNLMEVSLRSVVDALIEDMGLQFTGPRMSLAKLLPPLAQMSPLLLEEPTTYDVSNLNLDDLKDNVELSSLEFQAKLILKRWIQL
ncbi:hypothetical protein GIB67_015590 [Kingdonia uniflora]|uniref:Uncharacterized protein n=1 Tax=Kingdonia uniflora TaxID=39325 RepID=A0A7J7LUD1_9MAGN|nr:hypothetical protein GIB67_015590 [Kingdonia uniflora]